MLVRHTFKFLWQICKNVKPVGKNQRQSCSLENTLNPSTFGLTRLAEAGYFRGVKGQLEVGLCPLSKPIFFLFNTDFIGLEAFELETGVLP